jgi:hypothetical protein
MACECPCVYGCDADIDCSPQVFRKLNSVTVPYLVSVPKSAEEEKKKKGN